MSEYIYGALVGSGLTLVGVLLTLLFSHYRLHAELKHDAIQRDRERELSLKRDVYLPVAESITKSLELLTRIPDTELSDKQISSEFSRYSGAISKIHITAKNKTLQAVFVYQNALSAAYMELFLKRFNLMKRKQRIEILDDLISNSLEKQKHYNDLMSEGNIEGNIDQRKWQVITASLDFETNQFDKYMKEKGQLWESHVAETLELLEFCSEHYMNISALIPPAIFAVRHELELPIDEQEYMEVFNEYHDKGRAKIDTFIVEVKEKLANLDT